MVEESLWELTPIGGGVGGFKEESPQRESLS